MKNYAVIRTDRMFGTDNRAGLVSVLIPDEYNDSPLEHLENGCVVVLNGLTEGERELYAIQQTTGSETDLTNLAILATPELLYDERLHNLDDFTNMAGKAARAYRPHHGDIFSVTKEGLDVGAATDPIAVGWAINTKAGWKLSAADDSGNPGAALGRVIAVDNTGRYTYYVIQIN